MNHQADYCVLGAGLAGLSLADTLQEQDFSTIVIEKKSAGSGASGTPGGLVNPATGRRATKAWKAEQCYEAISRNLQKVQERAPGRFYQNNGLLRPALLQKMARKMKKQLDKTTWPKGWCQWKSCEEIREIHPGINCVNGGLWLPIGLTVDIGMYMSAYADYLKEQKVTILEQTTARSIHQDRNSWHIELENETIRAQNLIFATGYSTNNFSYWDWLPLHPIKGQVAKFKTTDGEPLSFQHSISSLGYMAVTGKADNTFVQGSTYEHDFEDLNPDKSGEEYLRERMRRTLPQLEERVEVIDQWAGVRISTPDKKPILGQHPELEKLHVFTGLGSKGLLYSKFLAEHYVEHLIKGTEIHPEINVKRFQ